MLYRDSYSSDPLTYLLIQHGRELAVWNPPTHDTGD